MTSTTNYLNYSIIAAAFIAMVIRKYNYSYMFFSFLIGWNILTNFVSGDIKNSITNAKLPYIIFSIILFFTLLYLTVITVKNADLFDKSLGGDLEFYLNTSNILVLFVTILIISNEELTKYLEIVMPQCGSLILLLFTFLFIYLIGVMVINVGIIIDKKFTDG